MDDYFGPINRSIQLTNVSKIIISNVTEIPDVISGNNLSILEILTITIFVCCCYCCCCCVFKSNSNSVYTVPDFGESNSESYYNDQNYIEPSIQENKSITITIPINILEPIEEKSKLEEEICVICLDNFNQEDDIVGILKCEHLYHRDCIKQWFKKNTTCPICRTDSIV